MSINVDYVVTPIKRLHKLWPIRIACKVVDTRLHTERLADMEDQSTLRTPLREFKP